MTPPPPWAALALAVLGGVASAAQGAVNAELGERVGAPAMGAVVNNLGGCLVVLVGLLLFRTGRSGLRALRQARPPWWCYLGGLGGTVIVVVATYAVPVLGVAVFTIAQVVGSSLGGLAADRAGLAPGRRRAVTPLRLLGASLAVVGVALAQLGRPVGDLVLGLVLLAVGGGLAVALQAALNSRVSAVSGMATSTAINFAVSTTGVFVIAALVGAFTAVGRSGWPPTWYLYTGGLLAVGIVLVLLVGVRAVGVLRTGLAIVVGQLGGALLLDAVLPGGPGVRLPVLAGALLTLVAVLVAGRNTGGDR